ncbi:MAG: hypothetical protein EOR99_15575 [Mesorhizobium sp.]|uniref:hypothetical protein n=1 Tax=unclassified Mesorhizobium TaxID=325217 RepID=UPI000F761BE6|nr:hypothetical protein [Mesorhizobium sp. M6A.T.Cr.TU.016.01.1.1]AZO66157.1 hypothetical protein EJ075_14965 [Mesorhizobium sp. M6A.T.Cr.TU.016.01.1.1]RWN66581.1 MAG: hypothetical protein EOR99_15575 [Mesorhizobium sp.]
MERLSKITMSDMRRQKKPPLWQYGGSGGREATHNAMKSMTRMAEGKPPRGWQWLLQKGEGLRG